MNEHLIFELKVNNFWPNNSKYRSNNHNASMIRLVSRACSGAVFTYSTPSVQRSYWSRRNEECPRKRAESSAKRQDDLHHVSVAGCLDSSRRLGLLAGRRRRQRRRMYLSRLFTLALAAGTMARRRSPAPKMDWRRAGRALPRQAERQLTGHIRTRLLYVAITRNLSRSPAAHSGPCHFQTSLNASLHRLKQYSSEFN